MFKLRISAVIFITAFILPLSKVENNIFYSRGFTMTVYIQNINLDTGFLIILCVFVWWWCNRK